MAPSDARTTATVPARRAPATTTGTSVGRAVQTWSPVLLLIVARVLWTARPPVRPALGAEATMAEPVGSDDLQMAAGGALHLPTGPLHGRDDLFGFLGPPAFGGWLFLQRHAS